VSEFEIVSVLISLEARIVGHRLKNIQR